MVRGWVPVVVGVVVLVDVLSKNVVQRFATPWFLTAGVSLQPVATTRGLFGALPLGITVGVSIVVLLALLFALRRALSRHEHLGISLIIGGGIANLAERIAAGHVTDILLIEGLSVWNVADLAILSGLLVVLGSWFVRRTVGQHRTPIKVKMLDKSDKRPYPESE